MKRILARKSYDTPNGRVILVCCQRDGDPLVSIYARYWLPGESTDDAPEIRCRCKREQANQFWDLAKAQIAILLGMDSPVLADA